ncbi:hypothetical protein [Pseudomonas sp. MWU12-2029]|uniref:hypothetical protein n=1 Tax=Pseudomonas sp. MWU12-2029 TaxID=2927805 RepID=UPI00200ECD76|nr:hypothetical protein [Pseudomonas sp. MWU12-2029]
MLKLDKKIVITGFHGTSSEYASRITDENFIIQYGPEDWLGHGAYFFIDGISCPIQSANEWAKNTYKNHATSVIRSTIEVSESSILDLRKIENLKRYNLIREQKIQEFYSTLASRRDLGIKKRKDIRVDDRIITNLVVRQLNTSVLIHNVYIKTGQQRELVLESSYPNATVCSVNDINLIVRNERIEDA